MKRMKFTYWEDGQFFVGFLKDYPDYKTQGESKKELILNLKDILKTLKPSKNRFQLTTI